MSSWPIEYLRTYLSPRTLTGLKMDFYRLPARLKHQLGTQRRRPAEPKLHFGCGRRRISGWLNVDVAGSEFDVDLCRPLPWQDKAFTHVVSQHVIEHLELERQLLPLLRELYRVTSPGAVMWLSTPDLQRVCEDYSRDRGKTLFADRQTRFAMPLPEGAPVQHMINILFHQWGEHANLFDDELMRWMLTATGFTDVRRSDEKAFLAEFPEFPPRNDDYQSIYVRCVRGA